MFFIFLASLSLLAFCAGRIYVFLLIWVYTILANIFVAKQFDLFGLAITWWNALYGAIFLLTDIINEHYGKKNWLKAVRVWFFSMFIFVSSIFFLLSFNANSFDESQFHLESLFSITPRILIGSILAYSISQSLDIFIYDFIKRKTKKKYIFLRNNVSTMISQFIDTLIFTFVWLTGFYIFPWIISLNIFWEVVFATYLVKILISILDTPFLYATVYIKKYKQSKAKH